MTRFARAKGSKSSNERAPEDSTPWEVMKDQLLQAKKESEESKKREEAEQQRIQNYENFLKEHKSQKRKATWCDFPEAESNKTNLQQVEPTSKKKKKNKQKQLHEIAQPAQISNNAKETIVSTTPNKKSKKNKQNKISEEVLLQTQVQQNGTEQAEPATQEYVEVNTEKSTKKKLKKNKQNKLNSEVASQAAQPKHDDLNEQPQQVTSQNKKNRNKKNKKQNVVSEENRHTEENRNPEENRHREVNGNQKKANNNKSNQNNNQEKKIKEKKFVDGIPVRRKPINDQSFQFIINGKDVELVRFDGFPIMKRDAERLTELKSNMIKKGIPKSEVNRTLKLERRRAEKALARLKRDVCYNCRKGGHNLSDCPDLKTKIPGVGAADGVCFKCGSTEHRQFECKVQKDKEFRFATCFICKEPGHIARQCPDNPKGLYPNGGGCKLCGDVTHLRKDCPTMSGKKEETSIKLQTLDSTDNLEGIEQRVNTTSQETTKKPKKIKF